TAGLVLCIVGIGSRHNAPSAAGPLLALPLLALPALRRWRWRWAKALVAGLGGTALAGGIALSLTAALAPLAKRDEFWQTLPVHDLAGLSLQTGELLVAPSSGVLTRGMGLDQIRALYHPYYARSLYYCLRWHGRRCVPLFRRTHDAQALARLRKNWRRAVLSHPRAYLQVKSRMARALLGLGKGEPDGTYYVDDFPHTPIAKSDPPTPQTVRWMNWFDAHIDALGMRPWPYALLCLVLSPIALWRYLKGRSSALPLAFASSGLLCLLGLVIVAGSPDYRYMGWTMLCGVLSLVTTWGYPAERRTSVAASDTSEPLSAPLEVRSDVSGKVLPSAS
ncbi:MAG TPA: hypothetical protein VNN80_20015, partial [Polyangiaceae bacterium]|nr:hypothetical protein [Polyangiaceae bacterium]